MIIKRLLLGLSIITFVLLPGTAIAATGSNAVDCGVLPQSVCDAAVGNNTTPVTSPTQAISPLVDFFVNIFVGIFGTVVVLIIIISGVQISASAGNEEVVKKGKENIFKAVTGLVLLISFRAIFSLVDRSFAGVSTGAIFSPSGGLAPNGIPLLLTNIIGIASLAAGAVSVIMIIVGGIQYIGSGGGDGLAKAKKTITYAVTGLVIAIAAYTIVSFISSQLQ